MWGGGGGGAEQTGASHTGGTKGKDAEIEHALHA